MTGEETAAKIAEHEQRLVGAEHRIKDLEEMQKRLDALVLSVEKMAYSMEGMLKVQKEQGESIKYLQQKPLEDYNIFRKTAITAVISAIAGAFATGIIAVFANII